ncbi:TPA: hypothetical protein HA265_04080 [Candidatus Woesearchaeota archaeon]|nr:hypothetical protein [Candidatus Woesearchaeota archaeon]
MSDNISRRDFLFRSGSSVLAAVALAAGCHGRGIAGSGDASVSNDASAMPDADLDAYVDASYDASLDASLDASPDAQPDASTGCQGTVSFEYAPGQSCSVELRLEQDGTLYHLPSNQRIHYQEINVPGIPDTIPENYPVFMGEFLLIKRFDSQYMRLLQYTGFSAGQATFQDLCTGAQVNANTYHDVNTDIYHGSVNTGDYSFNFRVWNNGLHADLNDDGQTDGSQIADLVDLLGCTP